MGSDFAGNSMVTTRNHTATITEVAIEGLMMKPKRLPSFLFYDEQGDHLFRRIMASPDYYLTRCETEIIETNKGTLSILFEKAGTPFDIVELGAGDATKTEILLDWMTDQGIDFTYVPVDISQHVLDLLCSRLNKNIPHLEINPVNARIESIHEKLSGNRRRVFLYLGANIGNFSFAEAKHFLRQLANGMNQKDLMLVGFDLKKDPRKILRAYDDAAGITKEFSLNLLRRLNRECGANFHLSHFSHFPSYDPESGLTRSFLVSNADQVVTFGQTGKSIHFRQWETIHTEVSLKFDTLMIEDLAESAGLEVAEFFYDAQYMFCDVLFSK